MKAELHSDQVAERLGLIASSWWKRYRGAWTITVTAQDLHTMATRTHTLGSIDRYAEPITCPHCGGLVGNPQAG